MAIILPEGFLLKLMEFVESRPFMEVRCKWLHFEFSVIQMSHGAAEVPVLMRSSTLHIRVIKPLAWKWHTYFQYLFRLLVRNKQFNMPWLFFSPLTALWPRFTRALFWSFSYYTKWDSCLTFKSLACIAANNCCVLSHSLRRNYFLSASY